MAGIGMNTHAFRNNEDPYRRIVRERFDIDIIVAEIARRAGTGTDPIVAFVQPLAEQDSFDHRSDDRSCPSSVSTPATGDIVLGLTREQRVHASPHHTQGNPE